MRRQKRGNKDGKREKGYLLNFALHAVHKAAVCGVVLGVEFPWKGDSGPTALYGDTDAKAHILVLFTPIIACTL